MQQARAECGDGFEVQTDMGSNELVIRLSPSLAHAVGAFMWKSFANDLPVDDRRVVLAAALCNLSEFMQGRLVGKTLID